MAVNLSQVDLSNVQANALLEPIPAGWYNATIIETEMKETNDKTGQYMEVVSQIADGPHKGRKLFDRLNLVNNNAQAVSIAYGTLKQIYNAVGKARVDTSAELHGLPLKVKVSLRPAETGRDGKAYEARNEVKGYDHISSDHNTGAGVGGSIAPGVAGAPAGVPAWAAGQAAPSPAAAPPSTPAPAPAAAAAPIPSGAQPWAQPGASAPPPAAPAAAPAPVPAGVQLTAKANGLTLQDFYAQGWTDDTLVAHGYATRPAPAPAPAPVAPPAAPSPVAPPAAPAMPSAPGVPGAPAAATGAPGGPVPPWAQ